MYSCIIPNRAHRECFISENYGNRKAQVGNGKVYKCNLRTIINLNLIVMDGSINDVLALLPKRKYYLVSETSCHKAKYIYVYSECMTIQI